MTNKERKVGDECWYIEGSSRNPLIICSKIRFLHGNYVGTTDDLVSIVRLYHTKEEAKKYLHDYIDKL